MARFRELFSRYQRNEGGSVVVELVIILPLLFWVLVALYAFWDLYRSMNVLQKAAYTVSDTISRTQKDTPLASSDIKGYYDLMNFLIETDQEAVIRITEYTYDDEEDEYLVNWSCGMGGGLTPLTTENLATVREYLPVMPDSDINILFEARVPYKSAFNIGFYGYDFTRTGFDFSDDKRIIDADMLKEFVITRPRDGKFTLESCPSI